MHDVVCKLSVGVGSPHIRRETRFYTHEFQKLWGAYVPYYYGRFEALLRDYSVVCFIIERGDPVPEDKRLGEVSKGLRYVNSYPAHTRPTQSSCGVDGKF